MILTRPPETMDLIFDATRSVRSPPQSSGRGTLRKFVQREFTA